MNHLSFHFHNAAAPFDENLPDDDPDEEDEEDLPLDFLDTETLAAVGPAGEQVNKGVGGGLSLNL